MWIGIYDRLNIYDGQEIEEFKTRDKEDYLSGNLIDNIVYTGEDIYWIQTYYGLNRLNRKTNTITHYNEFQKLFFMNKDSHGNLFIIRIVTAFIIIIKRRSLQENQYHGNPDFRYRKLLYRR